MVVKDSFVNTNMSKQTKQSNNSSSRFILDKGEVKGFNVKEDKTTAEIERLIKEKIGELELKAEKIVEAVELKSWDRVNERIEKKLTQTWKYVTAVALIIFSTLTFGGFLSIQHIKDLTTNKISEILLQKPDFKETVFKAVSDTLSKSLQEMTKLLNDYKIQMNDSLRTQDNKLFYQLSDFVV